MQRDETQRAGNGSFVWVCKCDCGNYTSVGRSSLVQGNTRSCGCMREDTGLAMSRGVIDMKGKKIGRLTVVERARMAPGMASCVYWKCLCECGNETKVAGYSLRAGITQSCGCLQRERAGGRPPGKGRDLTGVTFKRWKVLELDKDRTEEEGRTYYICECQTCGERHSRARQDIVHKRSHACGCEFLPYSIRRGESTPSAITEAQNAPDIIQEIKRRPLESLTEKEREDAKLHGVSYYGCGASWEEVADLLHLSEEDAVVLCATPAQRRRWENVRKPQIQEAAASAMGDATSTLSGS